MEKRRTIMGKLGLGLAILSWAALHQADHMSPAMISHAGDPGWISFNVCWWVGVICGPASLAVSVLALFLDRPKSWAIVGTSVSVFAAIYSLGFLAFFL